MNRETRDERLRSLLREGDPEAGEPGLSLEEVREMRRAVLNAVPERRRRLLPAFALAGGALAAAVALVAALLLQRPEAAPVPAPRVARAPVAPAVKGTEGTAATAETPKTEKVEKVKTTAKKRLHRRRVPAAPVTSEIPDRLASAAPPVETEEPRQIQFSTPGGTRIIWVISPGEASHTK